MLIFNEKAYFFRRKKGEEQKKTRSILLNLVPCYLETVLIGQPHYEKDLGDQITFIKFDPYGNNYDELMVGTYNAAEKGIVTRYLLGTDQDSFELEPLKDCRWNGLVKVKDIDYRQ